MTQRMVSYRSCEFCDFWFSAREMICPSCGKLNRIIAVPASTVASDIHEIEREALRSDASFQSICRICIQQNPYTAKRCLTCPYAQDNAEEESFLHESIEKRKRSHAHHPWRSFLIPVLVSIILTLLAFPLAQYVRSMYRQGSFAPWAAAKRIERQLLEPLNVPPLSENQGKPTELGKGFSEQKSGRKLVPHSS